MSMLNPDAFNDARDNIDTTHPDEWQAYKNGSMTLGELHDIIKKYVEDRAM
tara:strand:+ start:402 stop:554 length:153 start_codon:yes stop_codon:yes gene_type:complete